MHKIKRKMPGKQNKFRHCMQRSDLSILLFPFSLAPFARVFFFSLTPVYFSSLSSPRAYVTADRFIETLLRAFKFFIWLEITRSYSIRFTHFSIVLHDLLLFSISLPLSLYLSFALTLRCRIYVLSHSSFSLAAPLVRSILLHFSRDRSSPFFSPLSLYTPSPFLFPSLFLSRTPSPLLSSSVIRPSPSCSVSSSPPFQLSSIFRDALSPQRGNRLTYCYARRLHFSKS